MDIILVSLKKEIDLFLDLLTQVRKRRDSGVILYEGMLQGNTVTVIRTGIGNKALAPSLFRNCRNVISTGFCGALLPGLKAGDVILSHEILCADSDYLSYIFSKRDEKTPHVEGPVRTVDVDEEAVSTLIEALRTEGFSVRGGRTVTAGRIIKTSIEKSVLHASTGAISVDMEDYHRFQCAEQLNVQFVSIRSVLDSVEDEIPGFKRGFHCASDLSALLRNVSSAQTAIAVSLEKLFSLKT